MKGKGQIFQAMVVAMLPSLALATGPSRGLPRGEEHPHYIEIVYSSPVGEVQFTEVNGGYSGFLRNSRGNMMGFQEVRGSAACETWMSNKKNSPPPSGCEFFFYDNYDGRTLSVRSEEMIETDLFQAASGKLRGFEGGKNVSI